VASPRGQISAATRLQSSPDSRVFAERALARQNHEREQRRAEEQMRAKVRRLLLEQRRPHREAITRRAGERSAPAALSSRLAPLRFAARRPPSSHASTSNAERIERAQTCR